MSGEARKVLITGVTGFIGSHLAQALSGEHEVYGLLKYSTSRNLKKLEPFLRDVILLTGDISDYHTISHVLHSVGPDVVVHLAAMSPVRGSFDMPFSYVQANVTGTLNIAHAMLDLPDFKRRKLIYASTAEVYGIQKKQPIPEGAVLNPSSPYANTKSMTDTYLRMMTGVYGLNTTVMRCVNTFGRKIETGFFVEYLVTSMLRGEKVYIGAPDSLRDYMYVDDHVSAYAAAIRGHDIKGEAFNAAPGFIYSNRKMAEMIARRVGYDARQIVYGKYPPNYPLRPLASDQPFINLDSSKIRRILKWRPKVSLEDGLDRTITYWGQELGCSKQAR
jgi:nucleoside-diphosphate-sugar epimerase